MENNQTPTTRLPVLVAMVRQELGALNVFEKELHTIVDAPDYGIVKKYRDRIEKRIEEMRPQLLAVLKAAIADATEKLPEARGVFFGPPTLDTPVPLDCQKKRKRPTFVDVFAEIVCGLLTEKYEPASVVATFTEGVAHPEYVKVFSFLDNYGVTVAIQGEKNQHLLFTMQTFVPFVD